MFGLGTGELGAVFIIAIILSLFFIPGIIGANVARSKGRNTSGWGFLCLVMPLALIVLLFLPPAGVVEGQLRECPYCRELIQWRASICKHCRQPIDATTT